MKGSLKETCLWKRKSSRNEKSVEAGGKPITLISA
jgi:hypothetical protein